MAVRNYTQAERVALAGGLSRVDFDRVCVELELAVRALCDGKPPAAVAGAIHGLLCGNPSLRDAVDTIEAYCVATGGRPVRAVVIEVPVAGDGDHDG